MLIAPSPPLNLLFLFVLWQKSNKFRCVAPGFYNTILGSQENLMSTNVRNQRYPPPTNFKKAALNQPLSPLTSSEVSNILKTAIAKC